MFSALSLRFSRWLNARCPNVLINYQISLVFWDDNVNYKEHFYITTYFIVFCITFKGTVKQII